MCSESLPKEFEKTTEVLPFTKYGISSIEEFRKAEEDVSNLEWLKKVGLTGDEIKLYQDNEAGLLDHRKKIEAAALKTKLQSIYDKINRFQNDAGSSKSNDQPSTSTKPPNIFDQLHKAPLNFYPEGHPMNEIKELEQDLFGHLNNDKIMPITKRLKILRRLERKKERLNTQENLLLGTGRPKTERPRPGSLWDLKEAPSKVKSSQDKIIGPNLPTTYTIKENQIVQIRDQRVPDPRPEEPVQMPDNEPNDEVDDVPNSEGELLEGTKMCLDDIRKIDRFKDYEPGIPSKILYLKNISASVNQEQLSLLFNQFVLDNGGPVDVRLLAGRMRGQAFATFHDVNLAIQALEEINGTILSGRPIIAQFSHHRPDNR